jgi:hypothetical protein
MAKEFTIISLLPISPLANAYFILSIGVLGFGFAATAVILYRYCDGGREEED